LPAEPRQVVLQQQKPMTAHLLHAAATHIHRAKPSLYRCADAINPYSCPYSKRYQPQLPHCMVLLSARGACTVGMAAPEQINDITGSTDTHRRCLLHIYTCRSLHPVHTPCGRQSSAAGATCTGAVQLQNCALHSRSELQHII
jgi:hypothetical protein